MSEMPDVYRESRPRARKAHRCCECRGAIPAGEIYRLASGLWDGGWDTYKTCLDCVEIEDRFKASQGLRDDPLIFTELHEHVFESRFTTPEIIIRFVENRTRRGAAPSPKGWMEDRAEEARREIDQTEGGAP